MPISIVVPQLGESVAEGTVSKWLKAVGDRVRKEEPLVEIQTDKINVEIPSPAEGMLRAILVAEGTTVLVGTEIGVLAAAGEAAGARRAPAAPAAGGSAPPRRRRRGAAARGTRRRRRPRTGRAPSPAAAPAPAPAYASHGNGGAVTAEGAQPVARGAQADARAAACRPTSCGAIHGSGIAGRVTRDDLLDYLEAPPRRPAPRPPRAAAPPPAPAPPRPPRAARLPRRAHRAPAAAGAARGGRPVQQGAQADRREHGEGQAHRRAHALLRRGRHERDRRARARSGRPKLEAQGVKLTYMPFFIKASGARAQGVPVGERRGARATRWWSSTTTTSAWRSAATRRA